MFTMMRVLTLCLVMVAVVSEKLSTFKLPDKNGMPTTLAYVTKKPVVLLVNVASLCGYTDSNYKQLQKLYEKYEKDGLEIIAVPCNQFGAQEPAANADIQHFAKQNYKVSFPILGKTEVNGPNENELFTWLKNETGKEIQWNFTKFLIVNGEPQAGYAHDVEPRSIEKDIIKALRKTAEL